mgnify:FL=1
MTEHCEIIDEFIKKKVFLLINLIIQHQFIK